MSDDLSFHELVARLRAGDPQAAEEIWNRFGPHMIRVAKRELRVLRLTNYVESEDICQSAIHQLIARPPQREFRTASDLLAYIRDIITTKAKMKRRRLATQRRDIEREHTSRIENHELVDDAADPAQLAYVSELRSLIRANLRGQEWRIFELRDAGHECPEIASQVGGQADVLRIQHDRRMARIRRCLLVDV